MKTLSKHESRKRRHVRVRARVSGTAERPRLSVFRSLRGMYAQLVDDQNGVTIASAHSKNVTGDAGERTGKVAKAYLVGKALGEAAKAKNIDKAVFDRGGYKYHGRVQAVADGAREAGLQF